MDADKPLEPSGSSPEMTPTQAVDFNGAFVSKETGEEVTVEEMSQVLKNPPEEIVMYIFKKDKQPYTVEDIKQWQQSHRIQIPETVVEERADEVPERQDIEASRAATRNHRSEPMST